MGRSSFAAMTFACALGLGTIPAHAQDAPAPAAAASEKQVYTAADFAAFRPRSALDMVQQIPGFNIESNAFGQGRGLGQADGNVLLNGQRIVTKAGSISDELARIAADNVIRIELVDGSTLNIPGLSGRVANVVATSGDGLSAQFEWRPQLAAEYADMRWLEGIASVSGTWGGFGFTVAVEGRPVRNGNGGINVVTHGDGRVDERFSLNKANGDDKRLSGSLRYRTPGDTVANLNASYLSRRFHAFEDELLVAPVSAPPLTDEFDQVNRGHDLEFGGDVEFGLGPGRLKLIGLESSQSLDFLTQAVLDPATGAPPFGSRYRQLSERGERIGRSEYSWAAWGADWQLSLEGAFNKLDQIGDLFLLAPDGEFFQVPFPAANGGVREKRYEAMLSYSRPLAEGLTMQLIAGGEQSTIRLTGPNANSRTFQRPKGSLNFGWAPEPGFDLSLRLERAVGQLNFGDFLAAVSLSNNNQNDANNDLRPDQSWAIEIEATRDFGAWGSASLRTFIRRFEDFITFVPTETGLEARGNVEWARVMGAELTATLQLGPLGLDGAKLDLSAVVRDSIYPDPVEGGNLPVQFAQPHNVELDFRYDLPESVWAFGASYRNSGYNPYYRVAEFGLDYAIDENLAVFVEHKDVFGLTVQARFNNLLEREVVFQRSLYAGPRGSSPLLFSEDRKREVGRVVNFTVKGSF